MKVAQLWRYPVKSMGGETMDCVRLEAGGMPFDRRFAILDSDPTRAGKLLTGRLQHRMLAFQSTVLGGTVMVRTPSGAQYDVNDPAWLEQLEHDIGQAAAVRASDDPIHDDADVLVVNAASVRTVSEEYGARVSPLRFRPNVLLDGPDARPFDELRWPGRSFAIGDAVLEASSACIRCVITTIDPETLVSDPSFLRLMVEKHNARFGVYCKVVRAGEVRVGDPWTVYSAAEAAS
jgi:MOSC domain-containing protein